MKALFTLLCTAIIITSCSTGFDCKEYLEDRKKLAIEGEIEYLWFNGRNYSFKYRDFKSGKTKSYPGWSSYEIYSNAEKFKVGDTLIKKQGELIYTLKNNKKHIVI